MNPLSANSPELFPSAISRSRRHFIKSLTAGSLFAFAPRSTAEQEPLPSLCKLAAGRPLFGAAVMTNFDKNLTAEEKHILSTQFDSITPENCMKWTCLCPDTDEYRFEHADRMVEFATRNQQKIVGHTLIFNRDENFPKWLFLDGEKEADAKLVWKRVEAHIETLMSRYKGRIDSWDVLNEFIEVPKPGFRVTNLTRVLGPDYPVRLFKLAASIDPGAKLTYNDFSVENPDRMKAILSFVRSLRDQGCRIDLVGSQSHIELGDPSAERIDAMIKKFAVEGFRCALTELDVDVIPRRNHWNAKTNKKETNPDPYANGCPDEILKQQADLYGGVIAAVMANRKHVDRVSFWGITDRNSWLNNWPWKRVNHGLLFDRDAKAKPAFHAVAKALSGG